MSAAPFLASVTVTVPARLHLGFLDLNGGLGRRFGSIGVAISGPRTSITIRAASRMQVTGPERERVEGHIDAISARGHGATFRVTLPVVPTERTLER